MCGWAEQWVLLKRGEAVAIFLCIKGLRFLFLFLKGFSFTFFSYSECFIHFPPGNWKVLFFNGAALASNAPPLKCDGMLC